MTATLALGLVVLVTLVPATQLLEGSSEGRVLRVRLPLTIPYTPPPVVPRDPPVANANGEASLAEAQAAALAAAGAPPTRPAPPALRPGGLLAVDFDLLSPGGEDATVSATAVVIRKTFRIGDREIGSAQIHVDRNSRLMIETEQLNRLLAGAGIDRLVAQGNGSSSMMSFSELRLRGIDLRYEPTSDTVSLTVG